jgi:hypothetical protein
MSDSHTLKFTQEEVAMLVDALEVDLDGYVEAAGEARANNKRDDVKTFTEAAERIGALMKRLRALIDEDD